MGKILVCTAALVLAVASPIYAQGGGGDQGTAGAVIGSKVQAQVQCVAAPRQARVRREAKKWGPRPHQIVDLMEARGLPASRAQDVDKARALSEAMFGDA